MNLRTRVATFTAALLLVLSMFAFIAQSAAAQSCYTFINSAWTYGGRAYFQYAVDCSPIGGGSTATMTNNTTGGWTSLYASQGATRIYRTISLPDTGNSYNLTVRMPNGAVRNLGNWYMVGNRIYATNQEATAA